MRSSLSSFSPKNVANSVLADETIDSGLLYYSQSNHVLRVKAARNEIRGLLIARNEFATYLHRRMTLSTNGWPSSTQEATPQPTPKQEPAMSEDEEELWGDTTIEQDVEERPLLPAPIDEERSCKRCYVADACMLFRKVGVSSLDAKVF